MYPTMKKILGKTKFFFFVETHADKTHIHADITKSGSTITVTDLMEVGVKL